jgi:hypothetical protein
MIKNKYLATMETQLRKWDADMDALAAEGQKAADKARATYVSQIKELRLGRDSAHKRLEEIRAATEAAGIRMHAGMDAAWDTMQKALKTASANWKK